MKKSSYQKLKEENKKLRQDIHVLVNEKSSYRGIELQVIYSRPTMTPIMFGSRNGSGNGITDQIIKKDEGVGIKIMEFHRSLLSDDSLNMLFRKPYVPEFLTIKNYDAPDNGLPFVVEFTIPEDKLCTSGYYCLRSQIKVTLREPMVDIIKKSMIHTIGE